MVVKQQTHHASSIYLDRCVTQGTQGNAGNRNVKELFSGTRVCLFDRQTDRLCTRLHVLRSTVQCPYFVMATMHIDVVCYLQIPKQREVTWLSMRDKNIETICLNQMSLMQNPLLAQCPYREQRCVNALQCLHMHHNHACLCSVHMGMLMPVLKGQLYGQATRLNMCSLNQMPHRHQGNVNQKCVIESAILLLEIA